MSHPLVVLTGSPGTGKTTLTMKVVDKLRLKSPTTKLEGFCTEEIRGSHGRTGFKVKTLAGAEAVLAAKSEGGRGPRVGQYCVDVPGFEAAVLPVLGKGHGSGTVLVLDEVGRMELKSARFTAHIQQLLRAPPCPVLVTVPVPGAHPIPLVEAIRSHSRATVVTVTKANRNEEGLVERIADLLLNSSN